MSEQKKFTELSSGELKLVRLTKERADEAFRLRSDPEAMKYIERPRPKNLDDIIQFIQTLDEDFEAGRSMLWAVIYQPTNELAGTIAFYRIQPENRRAEIGYMLFPKFWGKGVMSKCIKLVLDFGFTALNFHSVEAHINPQNEGSRKILEKFGFVSEAYFRENFFFEGRFLDSEVFSLLKRDYMK
jgi:ribosomal-protein-alanine N-acetyltransferase